MKRVEFLSILVPTFEQQQLVHEAARLHPGLYKLRPASWREVESVALVILKDEWLKFTEVLPIHDRALRDRARPLIDTRHTNYAGDDGVLCLSPIQ